MSSSPMAVRPDDSVRVPLRYRVAGTLGCVCALVLVRIPAPVSLKLVSRLNGHTPRAASAHEAAAVVTAARAAGRFFPGRFACLESALSSALAALLLRRRVDWCIGARMMPYAAHSWIEAAGEPVGEPGFSDHPYLVLVRT
jgi:hypothetical protein